MSDAKQDIRESIQELCKVDEIRSDICELKQQLEEMQTAAEKTNRRVCENCRYYDTGMHLCRIAPAAIIKGVNEWCGKFERIPPEPLYFRKETIPSVWWKPWTWDSFRYVPCKKGDAGAVTHMNMLWDCYTHLR
jgi:hypothetical protein